MEVTSVEAATKNYFHGIVHGSFHAFVDGSFHELSPKMQIVQVAVLIPYLTYVSTCVVYQTRARVIKNTSRYV